MDTNIKTAGKPLDCTALADARQALSNAQRAVLYGQLNTVSRQLALLGMALHALEREGRQP